jgi:hypothetical protein
MSIMEQQMQQQYEAAEYYESKWLECMVKFEEWFLSVPDYDENLIVNKRGLYFYENEYVNDLFVAFASGARCQFPGDAK